MYVIGSKSMQYISFDQKVRNSCVILTKSMLEYMLLDQEGKTCYSIKKYDEMCVIGSKNMQYMSFDQKICCNICYLIKKYATNHVIQQQVCKNILYLIKKYTPIYFIQP